MRDPFLAPIPFLSKAVQPAADYLGFTTLPLHIHEVVISFLFYTWVNIYGSPIISRYLFPRQYGSLSRDKRLNWDVRRTPLSSRSCGSCFVKEKLTVGFGYRFTSFRSCKVLWSAPSHCGLCIMTRSARIWLGRNAYGGTPERLDWFKALLLVISFGTWLSLYKTSAILA